MLTNLKLEAGLTKFKKKGGDFIQILKQVAGGIIAFDSFQNGHVLLSGKMYWGQGYNRGSRKMPGGEAVALSSLG